MDSKKLPIERRWRNAIVLLLGICIACTIIAWVLPGNLEWAGIQVPFVIVMLGTLAGVTACLCAIIVVEMRKPKLP